MPRHQFTLRALLVAMLVVPVAAAVVSWLPPDYRLRLGALVVAAFCCFGMLGSAIWFLALAVGTVVFCYNRYRQTMSHEE